MSEHQNPNNPTTGPMVPPATTPRLIPEWQERQFRTLLAKLSEWRSEDHEDAIVLCRSEVIAILECFKFL